MVGKKEAEEVLLSEAFSETGENQLPYQEKDGLLIREQLIFLNAVYPSLSLRRDNYYWRTPKLLYASGTIPLVYETITYHTPVNIWLTELFPRSAPHVYVRPTPEMVIVKKHPFVTPDGFVTIDYLQKWVFPTSKLVHLCQKLTEAFSLHPPVYAKRRPGPNSFVNPPRIPNFKPKSVRVGRGGGRVSPNLSSESLFFSEAVTTALAAMVDQADISLSNSITHVVKSLCGEFDEKKKQYVEEYESWCWKREGERLGRRLQRVLFLADHLRDTVSNNGPPLTMGSVQNVISGKVYELSEQTLDVLSKKIVECTAFDVALNDVVEACYEPFLKRVISIEVYLKIVRLFSRLQFQKRATSFLVHDTLKTMESRASP